jgi:hypothetical protein
MAEPTYADRISKLEESARKQAETIRQIEKHVGLLTAEMPRPGVFDPPMASIERLASSLEGIYSLSMRDRFAASALQGLLAGTDLNGNLGVPDHEKAAEFCYDAADAFMAEKKRRAADAVRQAEAEQRTHEAAEDLARQQRKAAKTP